MINDIENWRIGDEHPEISLDTILPISKRAASLIARNKANPLLKSDFFRFQGAVEMMKGLDYHHDNFMAIIKQLAMVGAGAEAHVLQSVLLHEATAYLNRLGQFYYFLASAFVLKKYPAAKSCAPTICKYVFFRHKSSAHRSIDKPDKRKPESAHIQATQAMSMSSIGGRLFYPKPGQSHNSLDVKTIADAEEHVRKAYEKCFLVFQLITDDPKVFYDFALEKEHSVIMEEAFVVLRSVLS